MPTSLPDFLRHILDECNYIVGVSRGRSKEQLLNDETMKRAVARSIEIIGEAVKKLDPEFVSKYPHVEWKRIARSRDRIIHHYFDIDYDIVWNIVHDKIPDLKNHVEEILKELERGDA